MRDKRVFVVVSLIIGLIGISWYLGLQLNQAQTTRGVTFAEYYRIMLNSLRAGTASLQEYLETRSDAALRQANVEIATVSNVARPLVRLVPKGMDGPWSRFMRNDWGMITKSIDKLNERVRYFTVAGLSEDDLVYVETLIGELKEIIKAMDAPIVADGDAPGVRLRMDEVEKMSKMVQKTVALAESYLLNGVPPHVAEEAKLSWEDAVTIARSELSLDESEWQLVDKESATIALRVGHDFYNLRFKPTSQVAGNKKELLVGVHRQEGRLVLVEWKQPVAKNAEAVSPEELEAWALEATASLPGDKLVFEIYQAEGEHPWAVVVRTVNDIPVLTDYAIVSFEATTGELLKWENHNWGTQLGSWQATIPVIDVLPRLAKQINVTEMNGFSDHGLAVVRSTITDQPTLCY
ncbi:MAG: hypothetical protein GX033_06545, partial [Firmicutes bacterium]|nr:hypothetical protein [Bacillota bacterium]